MEITRNQWIFLAYLGSISYLRHSRFYFMQANAKAALDARHSKDKDKNNDKESKCFESNVEANMNVNEYTISQSTWRVHNLLTANELVFESFISMSVRGLFLTYAIPSISSVLQKTGGFNKDVKRRYADMELLIREFNENAVDGTVEFNGMPERAKKSLLRLNAIHSQYSNIITYKDMVYVLVVFATTPWILNTRWSWRTTTIEERECIYYHWCDIGNIMGLDIETHFKSWDDMVKYKRDYELKYMKYSKCNYVVSHATIDYFLDGVIPKLLHNITRPVILQIMSILQETPEHAKALGLPKANPVLSIVVDVFLTLRASFMKFMIPPRPLSWKDRLTGFAGCPVPNFSGYSYNDTDTDTDNDKESKGGGCPFSFRPSRNLDFNNDTYGPTDSSDAYIIEEMGPSHVTLGKLVENPVYLGSTEKKIL
jgi:hypothetical protein